MNNLGECLRNLRKQKGLTQKQVALEIRISESGYGFFEQGRRKPDITYLTKLAEIFEVSVEYLIEVDLGKVPFNAPLIEKTKIMSILKRERNRLGYSQQQLAILLHVSKSTLASWEIGRTEPNYIILCKLAEIFEISIEEFKNIPTKNNL